MRKIEQVAESRKWLLLGGWCLFFLGLWQILLWAQNPSLMSDDSGEMIAASYGLGIPHPPGYPLFCLAGRLFSFIPLGTVAFRFNLLSSLFVLGALYFVSRTCLDFLKLEEGRGVVGCWAGKVACLSVLLFLFSCRSVFAQALTAKGCVYTLTFFFLSLLWWLRVRNTGKSLSRAMVFLVWFLWALGMANHWESEVLWIPFLLYWFWQEGLKLSLKGIFQTLSVILMGFSLYLYLPLRAVLGAQPSWGSPISLKEFIWVITRESYRGMEPLFRSAPLYVSFLKEYLHILTIYWLPGFVFVALAGLFYLWRYQRSLFYSSLIFYLPVVLAVLLVPREETKFLLTVYLVSTQAIVAFWSLSGILFLYEKVLELNPRFLIYGLIFLLGTACFWVVWTFHHEDKSRYTLASDFSINALKTLPRHSIFLAEGDNYVVPLFYERLVEGKRKDIVFIPSIFLLHDWGWKQLAGQDSQVTSAVQSSNTMDGRLNALTSLDNRELFYTLDQSYLSPALSRMKGGWYPWALEKRWYAKAPSIEWVFQTGRNLADAERLRGVELAYDPEDVTTFEIHHYYANQYFETGRWLRQELRPDEALSFFDRGLFFYPQAAYAYADMAAILGSEGYLELARRLCQIGIQADPAYEANYVNLAYVDYLQGDDTQARNCYQAAFGKVKDDRWVETQEASLEKRIAVKNRQNFLDQDSTKYRLLAVKFQNEGMTFLSGLTHAIGTGL